MFTPKNLDEIRVELDKMLLEYGKQKGIAFQIGNISYTGNSFSTTLKCVEGSTSDAVDREEWNKYCAKFDLTPEDFGKKFAYQEKKWQVVGIKPYSQNSIVVKEIDSGKLYKFFPSRVAAEIKLNPII